MSDIADIAEQRPLFYEGEVLSASDLEQLVVYVRDQNARHLLGGHTWGIVAGLQLLEQTSTGGTVDVYLLPGYAVDGYGRSIVVVNPVRLDVNQFNGQPDGPVQVWLRYDQGETSAARPGFQVCCNGGDAYSRIAESYAIEVGFKSLASQQSGIAVGGETVDDARTALRTFNDAGVIVCDASVPYQDLPLADDTKSHWLIPLGEVGWQGGTPGSFVTLVESDPWKVIHSRRLRRYVGVVAENVYAADGLIRLRGRTTEVAGTVTQQVVDKACHPGDLADKSHDADLENCTEGPTPTELVWVEGNLRVIGDTRIDGGRLELRDANNTSYYPPTAQGSVPTFLERTDHVTNPNENNADLAIVIGKAGSGNNRLLIQQATAKTTAPLPCQPVKFDYSTKVTVLDKGYVGIGTEEPDQLLEVESPDQAFIHIKDVNAPSEMFLGAGDDGGIIATGTGNDLRIRTGASQPTDDKKTRMIVLESGQIGMGTEHPDTDYELTVEAAGQAAILLRTADDKHQGLLQTKPNATLISADTPNDDLILSCDADPAGKVFVKPSGNVGIGTPTPGHKLSIEDPTLAAVAMLRTGGAKLVIGADGGGTVIVAENKSNLRIKTDNTERMRITPDGQVGIGTDNPGTALDVNGDVSLGPAPYKYLAPGGYVNWIVVAGNVDINGLFVPGAGFVSIQVNPGVYQVTFLPPLANTPVVTVQLIGNPAVFGPPLPIVTDVDKTGFTVTMWGFTPINYAFSFIALVQR